MPVESGATNVTMVKLNFGLSGSGAAAASLLTYAGKPLLK
jgi:hypothetical protein